MFFFTVADSEWGATANKLGPLLDEISTVFCLGADTLKDAPNGMILLLENSHYFVIFKKKGTYRVWESLGLPQSVIDKELRMKTTPWENVCYQSGFIDSSTTTCGYYAYHLCYWAHHNSNNLRHAPTKAFDGILPYACPRSSTIAEYHKSQQLNVQELEINDRAIIYYTKVYYPQLLQFGAPVKSLAKSKFMLVGKAYEARIRTGDDKYTSDLTNPEPRSNEDFAEGLTPPKELTGGGRSRTGALIGGLANPNLYPNAKPAKYGLGATSGGLANPGLYPNAKPAKYGLGAVSGRGHNDGDPPALGRDPKTWGPPLGSGLPPPPGRDRSTWGPPLGSGMPPPLGRDPSTWAPSQTTEEDDAEMPPALGSDPATWSPYSGGAWGALAKVLSHAEPNRRMEITQGFSPSDFAHLTHHGFDPYDDHVKPMTPELKKKFFKNASASFWGGMKKLMPNDSETFDQMEKSAPGAPNTKPSKRAAGAMDRFHINYPEIKRILKSLPEQILPLFSSILPEFVREKLNLPAYPKTKLTPELKEALYRTLIENDVNINHLPKQTRSVLNKMSTLVSRSAKNQTGKLYLQATGTDLPNAKINDDNDSE